MVGLVQDIGAIPIIQLCAKKFGKPKNPEVLDDAIRQLSPQLSQWILQNWNLNPGVSAVPLQIQKTEREHEGLIDYADIVLVAKLHVVRNTDHPLASLAWHQVPAFKKLKLTPETSLEVIKEAKNEISEVIQLLKDWYTYRLQPHYQTSILHN